MTISGRIPNPPWKNIELFCPFCEGTFFPEVSDLGKPGVRGEPKLRESDGRWAWRTVCHHCHKPWLFEEVADDR